MEPICVVRRVEMNTSSEKDGRHDLSLANALIALSRQDNDRWTPGRLAKACRVSRFTIIRWIKAGMVRSTKTAAGYNIISEDEAFRVIKAFGFP